MFSLCPAKGRVIGIEENRHFISGVTEVKLGLYISDI
jgi:hypothetical protein